MRKLIIRKMQEDDIPAILEIERFSFGSPCAEQFFLYAIYKKNGFSRVAVFEGNIIGYICADHLLHETHVLDLAVHPDFRRLGVASLLINNAMGELKKKGCVFMYLEVRASNAGAQRFYELFGFRVVSIRRKYYGNPDEDALLMEARL